MGCDATLFRIPAGTFDMVRRARGFKDLARTLWAMDEEELAPPSGDIAKTRVELQGVWLELPLLFEAIDNAATPTGNINNQLEGRLKPVRGLRDLRGFTLSPREVMAVAATWARAAERAKVDFQPWVGPNSRLDMATLKTVFAAYPVIPPDQVSQVVEQLVESTVTSRLEVEYPFDFLVFTTTEMVRAFSEGAQADEGMLVLTDP